jgi:hypothetical protein
MATSHDSSSPPTFLLVPGAQKAGTTWLYHTLRKQPGARFPTKEAHVFDAHYVPAIRPMLDGRRRARIAQLEQQVREAPGSRAARAKLEFELGLQQAETDPDRYSELFSDWVSRYPDARLTGDFTPDHSLLTLDQMTHLHRAVARTGMAARVIVLLRDPVERTHSEMRFMLGFQAERLQDLSLPAPDELLAGTRDPVVSAHSRYERFVPDLQTVFGHEAVHIEFYESLFDDAAMRRIADFLGLSRIDADFTRVDNRSNFPHRLPADVLATVRQDLEPTYRWAVDVFGQERIARLWGWL